MEAIKCVDPLPHWIQIPVVIGCFIGIGFCWGWVTGTMFEHWWNGKIRGWLNGSHE